MKQKEIIELFKKTDVIQTGHFELSSGRHTDTYLQCAKIMQYPEYTNKLAKEIAEFWTEEDIDLVVGPAIGGIIISYAVASVMNLRNIFSERKDGKMKFRRNLDVKENENVLIVEDVVTTGGSVREVITLLEESNANIVGISSLVDRSNGEVEFDYQFKPLVKLEVDSFKANNCELCKKGIPINKPGSKKIKS
ncbi:MAG: orotate phosphoribosyltransferase [Bacillota bacterium]